jgi:hypothetical protein
MPASDIKANTDSQMDRIKEVNHKMFQEVSGIMFNCLSIHGENERAAAFRSALVTTYTNLLAKTRFDIASDETRRAWAFGQQG